MGRKRLTSGSEHDDPPGLEQLPQLGAAPGDPRHQGGAAPGAAAAARRRLAPSHGSY